jgi:hypothetical protein
MTGKLPKSKVWKPSAPDRLGLRLHPRYLSTDPLIESAWFWRSFHARSTRRTLGILEGLRTFRTSQPGLWGVYIGAKGKFHRYRRGGSMELDGRVATWRLYAPSMDWSHAKSWSTSHKGGQPAIEPFWDGLWSVVPTCSVNNRWVDCN